MCRTGKIVAMVQFAGSYTHVKAENVDAYMAAIGVPWIARKAAAAVTPALGDAVVINVLKTVSYVLCRDHPGWRGLDHVLENLGYFQHRQVQTWCGV